MSSYSINVPAPEAHDYHAAHHEERRRQALAALDVGDVLATIDDLIRQEVDPTKHPCFPVVNWLLDRQWSVDGGAFWEAWRALCQQALARWLDEALEREGD
jgi:hypothetical protein